MDLNSSPTCPYTVTIRRNPHRKARDTPKYTPQNFNLREIPPFPNDDVLFAAQNTPEVPSAASVQNKPENDNLRVFLRIRPLATASPSRAPRVREKSAWPQNPTKKSSAAAAAASKTLKKKQSSNTACISVNDSQSVTLSPPLDLQDSKRIKSETYGGFSHVFSSDSSQFDVYERMVKPMVDAFLEGKSGMVAALGPSGSGKTHTVFGSPRDPGMVPLVLRHIFKETLSEAKNSTRSFYISIFEIYTERGKSEKLYDLLPDGGELSMRQSAIKGLQEVHISNAEQAESSIAQAVAKRATAMTKTNSQSSRSQCIINIRDVPVMCEGAFNPKSDSAVLSIIDLAGAEREKRTGNQGTRLLESNFINNTLMVFGLCLRSLLEHQKNPKKPLQKHFQNSMLTRYMRDYLVGKKRMTLLLTAKSGVEDYLDTSYLLRQASPYMQIKYNEAEQSNVAPKKRHHQASSAMDCTKPSPMIKVEHRKKRKLGIGEDTVQNDGATIDESNNSKKDGSTLCKLDASHPVSFNLKCDSQSQSERSNIIMRNFAKVIWSVLKQYNFKLKVAEKEIKSLKECIGSEKEKFLVLETEFNEFKARCTCCKRGKESSQTSFDDQLDEVASVGISYAKLDSESQDRKVWISSPKITHHNSLDVEAISKISNESTKPKLVESDAEATTTCSQLDFKRSNRLVMEVLSPSSKNQNPFEIEAVGYIPSDTSCSPPSSVSRVDQGDVLELSTSLTHLDSENSGPCCHDVVTIDEATSRTLSESTERKIVESNGEPMLGDCTRSDSEKLDPSDELDVKPADSFSWTQLESDEKSTHSASCTESDSEKLDQIDDSDGKSAHGSSPTQSDSEKLDQIDNSDAKPMHGTCTLPDSEKSDKIEESEGKPMPGASCIQADSEKSDREFQATSSKPGHHIGLEVEDAIKISSGLMVSSSSIKDVVLDSCSPKHISSSTRDLVGDPLGEIGINNSGKPLRPKRTLMPKSSMLSRDFTFDVDESEKLKGTRKLAANDQKISNGSISLLRLLKAKNNPHRGRRN
ncbi:hypothetical protein PIB30_033431 [Stylosanthes scabra]|uniref:Kinesin motor domain-containing protein n=1 Tax=Stylosanthes scabra TaxID=79078 RepID=A0ABU6TDJ6_9FABA|nr:hypothetical protein [Stylosanthes scabra]